MLLADEDIEPILVYVTVHKESTLHIVDVLHLLEDMIL